MVLALFRQLFSGDSLANGVRLSGCTVHLPEGCTGGATGPWTTPAGDQIELTFQKGRPELPSAEIWPELVEHLKEPLPPNAKLVQCEPAVIAGHPALTIIVRTDIKNDHVGYRGRLIIPLRDRWWDFAVTAIEAGAVLRDATLLSTLNDPSARLPSDWNPDAAKFDFRFPHHAVSRVRKVLDFIAHKATFDPGLLSAPGWPLPSWTATPSGVMPAIRRAVIEE